MPSETGVLFAVQHAKIEHEQDDDDRQERQPHPHRLRQRFGKEKFHPEPQFFGQHDCAQGPLRTLRQSFRSAVRRCAANGARNPILDR